MSGHKCPEMVCPPGTWHSHKCNRTAAFEFDGEWWCKTHHPPTVSEKRAAKHAEWLAGHKRDEARREQERKAAAEQAHRAACFDDLLSALKEAADYTRHPDYDWPVEFSRQVSAAIAKAEGEA